LIFATPRSTIPSDQRGLRNVDNAAGNERATVIDPDCHRPPGGESVTRTRVPNGSVRSGQFVLNFSPLAVLVPASSSWRVHTMHSSHLWSRPRACCSRAGRVFRATTMLGRDDLGVATWAATWARRSLPSC
jgi:hypothetical protein